MDDERTSKRKKLISKLVEVLIEADNIVWQYDVQIPGQVYKELKSAIVAFGADALDPLHASIVENDIVVLIQSLGEIGDPSSVEYLINCHKTSNYASGLASLQSLTKIGTVEVYEYFMIILSELAEGDFSSFSTTSEATTAIRFLTMWQNEQSTVLLKQLLLQDQYGTDIPFASAEVLAQNPANYAYLSQIAEEHDELADKIQQLINSQ